MTLRLPPPRGGAGGDGRSGGGAAPFLPLHLAAAAGRDLVSTVTQLSLDGLRMPGGVRRAAAPFGTASMTFSSALRAPSPPSPLLVRARGVSDASDRTERAAASSELLAVGAATTAERFVEDVRVQTTHMEARVLISAEAQARYRYAHAHKSRAEDILALEAQLGAACLDGGSAAPRGARACPPSPSLVGLVAPPAASAFALAPAAAPAHKLPPPTWLRSSGIGMGGGGGSGSGPSFSGGGLFRWSAPRATAEVAPATTSAVDAVTAAAATPSFAPASSSQLLGLPLRARAPSLSSSSGAAPGHSGAALGVGGYSHLASSSSSATASSGGAAAFRGLAFSSSPGSISGAAAATAAHYSGQLLPGPRFSLASRAREVVVDADHRQQEHRRQLLLLLEQRREEEAAAEQAAAAAAAAAAATAAAVEVAVITAAAAAAAALNHRSEAEAIELSSGDDDDGGGELKGHGAPPTAFTISDSSDADDDAGDGDAGGDIVSRADSDATGGASPMLVEDEDGAIILSSDDEEEEEPVPEISELAAVAAAAAPHPPVSVAGGPGDPKAAFTALRQMSLTDAEERLLFDVRRGRET